jgi:hypothetical protein
MANGCEAGCLVFEGGDIRHHPDCQYYAQSYWKKLVDQEEVLKAKREEILRLGDVVLKLKARIFDLENPLIHTDTDGQESK